MVSSCRHPSQPVSDGETTESEVDTLPNDFVLFFNRFHEDTAYQMNHITFPLAGMPPTTGTGDTIMQERFFWQRANWTKHKPFNDPGGDFDHWYLVLNERIIEHWIQLKGTNMYMKRRFAKLDDEWYLIYYQGLRPGQPPTE